MPLSAAHLLEATIGTVALLLDNTALACPFFIYRGI
jgi:hypothetical protein